MAPGPSAVTHGTALPDGGTPHRRPPGMGGGSRARPPASSMSSRAAGHRQDRRATAPETPAAGGTRVELERAVHAPRVCGADTPEVSAVSQPVNRLSQPGNNVSYFLNLTTVTMGVATVGSGRWASADARRAGEQRTARREVRTMATGTAACHCPSASSA